MGTNKLSVSKTFVRQAIKSSQNYVTRHAKNMPQAENLHLGESREIFATILFIDLRGSTKLSQELSLDDQMKILYTYLTVATQVAKASGAYIEKYTGDGIMGIFGQSDIMPTAQDTVRNALETSKGIIQAVYNVVNPVFREQGLPEIHCAAGLDCGQILISRIGIRGENDLVAIGEAANMASKIENATRAGHVGIGHRAHKVLLPTGHAHRFLKNFLTFNSSIGDYSFYTYDVR
ncbi:adenylate/guanylate cyclase domain-containing protein [Alicyclobacillus mengziensis]|uniref:Adenylate/guanylate cyclase domain-containing protein n=1 Tax=Alicyclobacillus mengziensis TaxID=2931921 RepID=A0A9X7W2P3_9BACL|nr:adenylate/guanylate cyclase domain-containing protein [Alicyclobacillus mengziensis]QSO49185.1 adenylate/guanylate cyclase domain-containing protein [Alicyclobacillus mengziensis]